MTLDCLSTNYCRSDKKDDVMTMLAHSRSVQKTGAGSLFHLARYLVWNRLRTLSLSASREQDKRQHRDSGASCCSRCNRVFSLDCTMSSASCLWQLPRSLVHIFSTLPFSGHLLCSAIIYISLHIYASVDPSFEARSLWKAKLDEKELQSFFRKSLSVN